MQQKPELCTGLINYRAPIQTSCSYFKSRILFLALLVWVTYARTGWWFWRVQEGPSSWWTRFGFNIMMSSNNKTKHAWSHFETVLISYLISLLFNVCGLLTALLLEFFMLIFQMVNLGNVTNCDSLQGEYLNSFYLPMRHLGAQVLI